MKLESFAWKKDDKKAFVFLIIFIAAMMVAFHFSIKKTVNAMNEGKAVISSSDAGTVKNIIYLDKSMRVETNTHIFLISGYPLLSHGDQLVVEKKDNDTQFLCMANKKECEVIVRQLALQK
jgi:uncharacterized protein (UPF0333 family)